ncbi:MAG: hypothetical protein N4A40_02450 [Tissierellales bacterium]|nr:hypothetical protein [Tissierellales bacterium]
MRKYFKIMVSIFLLLISFMIIDIVLNEFSGYNTSAANYYRANSFAETGARNYVTAIYLDYRLFDSIFEATILFIVAAGVSYLGHSEK